MSVTVAVTIFMTSVFASRAMRLGVTATRLYSSQVTSSTASDSLIAGFHPRIGYGTYKVGFIPPSSASAKAGEKADAGDAVRILKAAFDTGLYKFMDCAEFYNNEDKVGEALASSSVSREDIFLASKVWTTTIERGPDAVKAQVRKCLADLRTDYIDLMCIHWPVPGHHVAAYKALEELQGEGLIKHLGVSNYAIEDYQELMSSKNEILTPPVVNQIEINPFLYRKKTIDFFQSQGVVLQSYRTLRDGKEFDNPTLKQIAEKHNKSVAQVLARWCVQKEVVAIMKSAKPLRMLENADVFGWELDQSDMHVLDQLTTTQAREKFLDSYMIGVVRDTSLQNRDPASAGVKQITSD